MRLNVLGPIELVASGQAVEAGPPKERVLLALLAMHADRVVPAEVLIDRLWSGSPPPSARGSLHVYVSNLRARLEPGRPRGGTPRILVGAAAGYGLMTERLELDLGQFEALVSAGATHLAAGRNSEAATALTSALGLWRGTPFADARAAEWAQPEIDRLEAARLDAIENLCAAELELGRQGDVIARLEPLLHRHPLREHAWELLALAYYRSGRQADALTSVSGIRRRLADELGIDPGPRLQALEGALLRQDAALLPTPPETRAHAAAADLAPARSSEAARPEDRFVGRAAALAALEEALTEARAAGRVVLVDGEPGVGKTALVRRFAGGVGVRVAWGASPDHESAPALWPWEQILRGLAASAPEVTVPPPIAAFLAGGLEGSPAADVPGQRWRFFEAVGGFLGSLAPAVIVLDDLHAADEATLRLLVHVAATATPGLLVIATLRRLDTEALGRTRAELARRGARHVELEGLTVEETRQLVAEMSGADPGSHHASSLRVRTGGNPFFLIEVARAGDAVPPGVRDVVRRRVEALGAETTHLLEIAALAGGEFELDVVAEASAQDPDDVGATLERATAAGLIREMPDRVGLYGFAHTLVADALLSRHSRLWRARGSERVAAALTRRHGEDAGHAAAIARCWLAASGLGPASARQALEFSARAANAALARHAPEDAASLWRDALGVAETAGASTEEAFELAVGLAESLYAAARFDDGYAAVERALVLAGSDAVRAVRVCDIAMGHGLWVPFRYGSDVGAVRAAMDDAVRVLVPSDPAWSTAQAVRAVVFAHTGDTDEAETVSAAAVAAADRAGDTVHVQRILHLRLIALQGQDTAQQRADTARRLLAMPGLAPHLRVIAQLQLVVAHTAHATVAAARELLAEIDGQLAELHNPALLLQAAVAHVGLDLFQGMPEPLRHLEPVEEVLPFTDVAYFDVAMVSIRIAQLLQADALSTEAGWIEEVHRRTRGAGIASVLAFAWAGAGEIARARALLRETPLPPRDYQWAAAAAARLLAAIRLDERDLVRDMYDLLRPYAGMLLVSGTCTTIVGSYDGLLGEALLALGDRDGARIHLRNAVRLLEAAGADFWLTRARQALANCL
ncbi:SARP family transcriptional regulator [Microbacterium mangrovi]|uniref:SARP family transcriptional regulator n=1 Tax=Microbacterium mangrovi TaxID=1348253 RepID=A0A0B2A589_9MICO|nr:AfsR/SARP family transcriptional regulator [Microbacterium mangrovi]KHK98674.1 SARP family transcriptional regulator [Microbacterium mangrovi]